MYLGTLIQVPTRFSSDCCKGPCGALLSCAGSQLGRGGFQKLWFVASLDVFVAFWLLSMAHADTIPSWKPHVQLQAKVVVHSSNDWQSLVSNFMAGRLGSPVVPFYALLIGPGCLLKLARNKDLPGKPVAHTYGLLSSNYGLVWAIVDCFCLGYLAFLVGLLGHLGATWRTSWPWTGTRCPKEHSDAFHPEGLSGIPEGPSTQDLSFLAPKTTPLNVLWTRVLKY